MKQSIYVILLTIFPVFTFSSQPPLQAQQPLQPVHKNPGTHNPTSDTTNSKSQFMIRGARTFGNSTFVPTTDHHQTPDCLKAYGYTAWSTGYFSNNSTDSFFKFIALGRDLPILYQKFNNPDQTFYKENFDKPGNLIPIKLPQQAKQPVDTNPNLVKSPTISDLSEH